MLVRGNENRIEVVNAEVGKPNAVQIKVHSLVQISENEARLSGNKPAMMSSNCKTLLMYPTYRQAVKKNRVENMRMTVYPDHCVEK